MACGWSQPRALGWEDAVNLADAALLQVKSGRRNGWCGVVDLPAADAATLARLEADGWAAALRAGTLRTLQGP